MWMDTTAQNERKLVLTKNPPRMPLRFFSSRESFFDCLKQVSNNGPILERKDANQNFRACSRGIKVEPF